MENLSSRLGELSQRVLEIETNYAVNKNKTAAELEETKAKLRKEMTDTKVSIDKKVDATVATVKTDSAAIEAKAKTDVATANADLTTNWEKVKSGVLCKIDEIETKREIRKHEHMVTKAEHNTQEAEEDALEAIAYAYLAGVAAEFAVLNVLETKASEVSIKLS